MDKFISEIFEPGGVLENKEIYEAKKERLEKTAEGIFLDMDKRLSTEAQLQISTGLV